MKEKKKEEEKIRERLLHKRSVSVKNINTKRENRMNQELDSNTDSIDNEDIVNNDNHIRIKRSVSPQMTS